MYGKTRRNLSIIHNRLFYIGAHCFVPSPNVKYGVELKLCDELNNIWCVPKAERRGIQNFELYQVVRGAVQDLESDWVIGRVMKAAQQNCAYVYGNRMEGNNVGRKVWWDKIMTGGNNEGRKSWREEIKHGHDHPQVVVDLLKHGRNSVNLLITKINKYTPVLSCWTKGKKCLKIFKKAFPNSQKRY